MSNFKIQPMKGGVRAIIGYGGGGKGGGSPRAPVESPDSLRSVAYANILDAISEGEIEGPATGLDNIGQSIYLDGTVLQNQDGSFNFDGVNIDFRRGTQDQDPIVGFAQNHYPLAIGAPLIFGTPVVRSITDTQLNAVLVTLALDSGLREIDRETGDTRGGQVDYAIDLSTDGGPFDEVLLGSFIGTQRSSYQRTQRIDLPAAVTGWNVRIRRLTPDSTNDLIVNATSVQSFSLVVDSRLRHPMTALVAIKLDATQFRSVPNVSYHMRGRRIRVPSNYDPQTRQYTGVWDGTFKVAYSNCPPWIWYDLISNVRYGTGDRIPAQSLLQARYMLYRIAQYCDELVPDGKGGMEPRFTCNVYIQEEADALKALMDLSSVFRGMTIFANDAVHVSADIPQDVFYEYNDTNIIDGLVSRSGSALSQRFNVVKGSWNDLTDMGRPKMEVVQDDASIAAMGGYRQTETVSFACTSQGQCQRSLRAILISSQVETQGVTFAVGLDGVISMPGQVIAINHASLQGERLGGRLVSATASTFETDAPVNAGPGDTVSVNLPSGMSEKRVIAAKVSDTQYSVTVPFSETPRPESIWNVQREDVKSMLYRVVDVAEGDNLTFVITAVEYNPSKHSAIDYETRIETPPITVRPPSVQPPPTNVQVTSYGVLRQGIQQQNAVFEWEAPENAVFYNLRWRRDNSEWVNVGRIAGVSVEVPNIYSGLYVVQVQAVNALEVASAWATSPGVSLDGIFGEPSAVASLQAKSLVFGIELSWGFKDDPNFLEKTRIRYGATTSFQDSVLLGEYAYPTSLTQLLGLRSGQVFYFWAQLIDKNGVAGPWFPAENATGVRGISETNAEDILSYLDGQIGKGQLTQDLVEEIDKIDIINMEIGDLVDGMEQLDEDLAALEQQVDALQGQVDDLLNGETWDPSKEYLTGAVVFEGGKMYRALQDVPAGTPVTNAVYWDYIGDYASLQGAVAALSLAVTQLNVRVTENEGQITAESERIDQLGARVTQNETGISGISGSVQQLTASVSDIQGQVQIMGSSITSLQGRVETAEGGILANAEAVSALNQSISQQDGRITANANNITKVQASLVSMRGGDSLIPDFIMANPLDWYSYYSTDPNALVPYFQTIADGKISGTVFRWDTTARNFNFSTTTLPISGQYRIRAWVRLSPDSDGSIRITAKYRKTNDADSGLTDGYTAHTVTDQVPRDGEWHLVDFNWKVNQQYPDQGFTGVRFGFAINYINTAGWSEIQGFRVTAIIREGDIDPTSVATASAVTDLSAVVTEQGNELGATSTLVTQLKADISALTSPSGNLLIDSNVEIVRSTPVYLFGRYYLVEDFEASQEYTLVVNYTHKPAAGDTTAHIAVWAAGGSNKVGELDKNVIKHTQVLKFTKSTNLAAPKELRFYYGPSPGTQAGEAVIHWATLYKGAVIPAMEWQPSLSELKSQSEANAGAIQSLSVTVTQHGNQLVSQGQSITELTAGVGNAQSSASAAQSAAQEAMAAAGQKGEVIYGTTTPGTAKRLPQNLWIDTTGNRNTPKRWNGSAWVAVTDKVATDAAAAADAAMQAANEAKTEAQAASTAVTSLGVNVTEIDGRVTANSQAITSLKSTVDDPQTGVVATAQAVNTLRTEVDETKAAAQIGWQVNASMRKSRKELSDAAINNAASLDAANVEIQDGKNQLVELSGNISQLGQVVVDQQGAMAALVTQVDVQMKTAISEVTVMAEESLKAVVKLDGEFRSAWAVKLQVDDNGVRFVAGVGLDLTNESGVTQSSFNVLADRFAVMHAAGATPKAVFVIQNGEAIFNAAVIGEATISYLKIADDMQSTNYVPSSLGWRLDKNGNFFNNGAGGGGRRTDTNVLTTIYHSNGNPVIRLGIW